ncbi:hypothetical protein HOE22_05830 [Candidatus Woesearchaeota archaeon]|nr:hypothetical protein [Candidatus Woesearchaeota archaeon]MBT7556680.1 hypothetical protein [Candidatus Woesearchaeota archaeon]
MKKKVSFTIDEDLMDWFKGHAKSELTSMSALVNTYILKLKRNSNNRILLDGQMKSDSSEGY